MFDINGKQLTGFDFTSVSSEFVNGTAKVKIKMKNMVLFHLLEK